MTNSVRITTRIPIDLHAHLMARAEEEGLDASDIVRRALRVELGLAAPVQRMASTIAPVTTLDLMQSSADGVAYAVDELEPAVDDFDESELRDDEPEQLPSGIRRIQGSAKAGETFGPETPGAIRSLRAAPKKEGKAWSPQHRE